MFDFANINDRDYIGIFISLTSDFRNVNVRDYIGIFISLMFDFLRAWFQMNCLYLMHRTSLIQNLQSYSTLLCSVEVANFNKCWITLLILHFEKNIWLAHEKLGGYG